MIKWTTLVVTLLLSCHVNSLDNGLALTPPMGWMSWQRFRCITNCEKYPKECISEDLFKRTADALVRDGYADAGYEYVVIDDCWLESKRDKSGRLVEDQKRFPSGIKALSDYIHSAGLKFGMYEDYGTHTCAGYPGVIDHMELDAQTFAEWEIDYLKLDGCYADIDDMDKGYPEVGRLLNKTGRPIVYSCSWPVYQEYNGKLPNYEALKEHCNLWRNWGDIQDSWGSLRSITDYFGKNQDRIQPHGGPGHWNDPDMLLIGNYGLSYDQSRAQMAVWAVLAAPLLISVDLDTIRPEFREILINKKVIAVNQDRLGVQGLLVGSKNNIEIWSRPVEPLSADGNYSYAVAFVSLRDDGSPYEVVRTLDSIGLKNTKGYKVENLYDNEVLEKVYTPDSEFETRVNPTGVQFYKFTAL